MPEVQKPHSIQLGVLSRLEIMSKAQMLQEEHIENNNIVACRAAGPNGGFSNGLS